MFLNHHRELRWVWVLSLALAILLLPGLLVGVAFGVLALVMSLSQSVDPSTLIADYGTIITILSQIISIGLVLLLFWIIYRRPMRQMGFSRKNWAGELMLGCALGILSMGAVFGILLATGQAVIDFTDWGIAASPAFLGSLLQFILVGFSEEMLTRGFMMTAMKTTRKPWLIVLVPSVIFGLLHAANPNVTLLAMTNLILAGVMFSLLFARTGKLWVPIGYHFTWNFFQGNIFGMAVSGGQTTSVIGSRFVGADWITGGAFGAEGGVVVTAVLAISIVILFFFIRPAAGDVWTYRSDLPLVRWPKHRRAAG